jgi:hypothetical protein
MWYAPEPEGAQRIEGAQRVSTGSRRARCLIVVAAQALNAQPVLQLLAGSEIMNTFDEEAKLRRAREDVAAIKGFYIHLLVYALVIALLFVINILTSSPWWVQWPLLGWGIGVLAHGLAVFGRAPPRWVTNWEAKKIQELKDKM